MPGIKDILNKNRLNELKSNNDDNGLLKYMEELRDNIDNLQEINELNVHIGKLKNQLNKEQGLLNNKDDDDVNAYYAYKAISTGTKPNVENLRSKGRDYYSEYNKAFNEFGGRKNEDGTVTPAVGVNISFNNNDDYNAFLEKSGYNDDYLKKQGIGIGYVGGHKTLGINKNNPNLMNILDNIDNTLVVDKPRFVTTMSSYMPYVPQSSPIKVQIKGYDVNGNALNSGEIFTALRYQPSPLPIYNMIKYRTRKLEEEKNADEMWNTNITVLPYITAGESRMQTKLDNNIIDEKTFKAWKEEEYNAVMRAIGTDNLTQLDVYADNVDDPIFKAVSAEDKHLLNRKLLNAIKENRVGQIAAAIAGTDLGIYITITDNTDNKGKPRGKDSFDSGQRLFIKGALSEVLEEAFEARTEWKAYKEAAEMQHYGYDYHLSDGSRIIKDNESITGWKYVYKDGHKEQIDDTGIRNKLNEDFIVQDATNYLKVLNRQEERRKTREYGITKALSTVDDRAFALAVNAIKELKPTLSTEDPDYWDEVYEIYDKLLNNAGYTGKRMFNKKIISE